MKKYILLLLSCGIFQLTPIVSQSLQWDWVKFCQGYGIPTIGELYIDTDSSIYASFSFQKYIMADSLTLQFQQKNIIDADLGVLKLDQNGHPIWAKRYGTNAVEHAGAIGRDLSGKLYAASDIRVFYTDPIDTLQPGLHRFYIDPQGNWLKARKVSPVAHRDKEGKELIIGTLKDTLILGKDTLTPGPGIPIYPEKYIAMRDSNHRYFWGKYLGHSDSLNATDLRFFDTNRILLIGTSGKSVTFCSDTSSSPHVFWAFFDTLGNCQSYHSLPMFGPSINRVLINAQKEIFLVGQFIGTFSFRGKTWQSDIRGYENFFIAKMDSTGEIIWINASEGIQNWGIAARDITQDLHGNIIVGGTAWGQSKIEETILGRDSIKDMFIAAFDPIEGTLLWTKQSDTDENVVGHAGRNFYWGNIYDIIITPTNQLLVLGNFLIPTYTLGTYQFYQQHEYQNFYIAALNLNITKAIDSEIEEQCPVHLAYHDRGISITENCPENPLTHFTLYTITGQEITLPTQERLGVGYYLGLNHSLSAGLYVLNWKRRDGSFGTQKFISLGE